MNLRASPSSALPKLFRASALAACHASCSWESVVSTSPINYWNQCRKPLRRCSRSMSVSWSSLLELPMVYRHDTSIESPRVNSTVQETNGLLLYSCRGIINPERLPLGLCAFFDISNRLCSQRHALLLNSHRTAEAQPCSSLAASPSAWPAARVFLPHNSACLSSPSAACISALAAH